MQLSFKSTFFYKLHFSNGKKKRPTKAKVLAITSEPPILGLILRSFVNGLVSATGTEVTNKRWQQIIDKVGAAVPYISRVRSGATISGFRLSNADFLFDTTLSYCRMTIIQPGRETSTTFVNRWTCAHHFSPCISMETIPAIKIVVTFGITCCILAMFSVCVCQIFVLGTYN